MSSSIERLAIVVVTYKRQALLRALLDSLLLLESAPWRVIVVDNENSDNTRHEVEVFSRLAAEGLTAVPWTEGGEVVEYIGMGENTGGAGGFAEGVRRAYSEGAEWFWLMDDDVEAAPDAIALLSRWTDRFDAVQGSRLDYDGGPFFWQHHFIEGLAMYDPLSSSRKTGHGWRHANALCFEGALFSRRVVDRLGPPDGRFFLYWDDCIYGYLASRFTEVALVDDVVLKRSRDVTHRELGNVRQLSSASDVTRYHIMRNRGHMGNYMKITGDYNAPGFAFGTALVLAKELIRLVAIDRSSFCSGMASLVRGMRDCRRILRDPEWRPVSPEDL